MLLSFYFHPDLSAGSFRTSALVSALLGVLPENSQLEVITTQPNRYSSFSLEAPLLEKHSRLIIHRIPIFQHNSGMLDQSRAFFSYLKGVLGITRNKDYDVVYATSSRLMTASLGALVPWWRGNCDVLCIWIFEISSSIQLRMCCQVG